MDAGADSASERVGLNAEQTHYVFRLVLDVVSLSDFWCSRINRATGYLTVHLLDLEAGASSSKGVLI
jgi:hypothetical protein